MFFAKNSSEISLAAALLLPWTQVSDLKGWKNAVAQEYGIEAIPFNFLVDPNGIILAKGLRSEDLENKLAEYIK